MTRRIGGFGGLAFIILTLTTLFLAPAPPEPSAAPAEVATYFRDNASGIELQAVVFGLAAVGLVAFGIGLHERVAGDRRHDGLGAAAWSGITLLVGGWGLSYALGAGLGLYGDRLTDDSIFLGMVAYGAVASLGLIGCAVMLACFAMLGRRTGTLPNWTVAVAVLGAALCLSGLASYTSDSSAIFAFLYTGFGALVIWMLAASAILIRDAAPDRAVITDAPAVAV